MIASAPDGTVMTYAQGPDPRFGMHAPIAKTASIRLPSGLTFTSSFADTTVLPDPKDLLSVVSINRTLVRNGRTESIAYEAATRGVSSRFPRGREVSEYLDALARQRMVKVPGRAPMQYTYDSFGR